MGNKNLNIIVKMQFGSHLYGTANENSDLDYKGIFMPTKELILLNRVPKSYSRNTKNNNRGKNTSDDIDIEIYSLHYFIKLACEGQTVALDMLHAPNAMIVTSSPVWDLIVENRDKFYTKNLKAFIGYARRQAAKYGIKGSRLNAAKSVIDVLERFSPSWTLASAWPELPRGEHLYFLGENPNGIRQYQVCGKVLQETQKIDYALGIVRKFHDAYGRRAQQAANNENVDWKAVSHALRAAYQVEELLTDKTITFPLKQAKHLLAIKNGELDFLTEVSPALEDLMGKVEVLSEKSDLPKKPDRKFWDQFIIKTIEEYYDFYA